MADEHDIGEGNEVTLVPIGEPWHVTLALFVVLAVLSLVVALNALSPPDHPLTAGQPAPAATPSPTGCDPNTGCTGLGP